MSIPAADIFAALPSAASDKTGRTVRPADVSRAERHHNGFSAVLQKVREADGKDELRKTDDRPSLSKADERSPAKEPRTGENDVRTRGKDDKSRAAAGTDTAQTRPVSQSTKKDDPSSVSTSKETGQGQVEQTDAPASQITNRGESDLSKETSGETFVAEVDSSITETESHLSADPQAAVPLFLSTLVASTTNQRPGDLGHDSEDNNALGTSDAPQSEDESDKTVSVVPGGATAALTTVKGGSNSAPLAGVNSTHQTQQSQTGSQLTAQAAQEVSAGITPESGQPSQPHDTAAPNTVVGESSSKHTTQDTSATGVKADSPELKDLKAAVAPITTDPTSEQPKADVEQKVKASVVDHPLLSTTLGQTHGTQNHDSSTVKQTAPAQQGVQPVVEANNEFRELWSGQQDGKQSQGDGKPVPLVLVDQQEPTGARPESFVSGAVSSNATITSAPPQPVAHAQGALPTHPMAQVPLAGAMRAVAFDVIQSDLGHVNVRVAMTNDIVHAYLSADRQDVGQSLISGQDRLQASLQANGLDMGQFRVDIDRQSAGRSFQQGFSQEQQERGWNQQATRDEGMPLARPSTDSRGPCQGLLNVMA